MNIINGLTSFSPTSLLEIDYCSISEDKKMIIGVGTFAVAIIFSFKIAKNFFHEDFKDKIDANIDIKSKVAKSLSKTDKVYKNDKIQANNFEDTSDGDGKAGVAKDGEVECGAETVKLIAQLRAEEEVGNEAAKAKAEFAKTIADAENALEATNKEAELVNALINEDKLTETLDDNEYIKVEPFSIMAT